ncbi:MAG: hypothetical protein H0T92_23055 [Pyrinomonadaceae bacterium]|nr:hypothetical protein [Pyrinomonadaceae bacterium]
MARHSPCRRSDTTEIFIEDGIELAAGFSKIQLKIRDSGPPAGQASTVKTKFYFENCIKDARLLLPNARSTPRASPQLRRLRRISE